MLASIQKRYLKRKLDLCWVSSLSILQYGYQKDQYLMKNNQKDQYLMKNNQNDQCLMKNNQNDQYLMKKTKMTSIS